MFPPQDPPQEITLPDTHRDFIENSVPRLKADPRILGVAVGGSYLLDAIDEFSDLDLVVYIDPQHYETVLTERSSIVENIGALLESFTGEHVGEPRLLICLFGPPLLHIDLKIVSMDDIEDKVENPVVLWERADVISRQVNLTPAEFPQPDLEWIEKRFWTWVHYTATKIGRGEIFEAVEAIGFLRVNVLGPIILKKSGARPQGLRKLERHTSQEELKRLIATLPSYDTRDCLRALHESVDVYIRIRETPGNQSLEKMVDEYLNQIESQLS
ncbi:MAG: nucleotidyltransferase domain-containing protein [FCB group bacterium]|nr:nucleotidyltransferase domain-containing protein [FCB group bacterium]MBL7027301.1 nucleotidyltransferase domain-containing protein [Candidatus Neomarinimicrobiota bacterium]MBL7122271.1 nucleotidyltransferase domain-containing protein [Candidatus Neomarinimicrobiota bacterium]